MSVDTYEQMTTGVSDITSIALVPIIDVNVVMEVDNRYKRGLLSTMLDRAYRLSSSWSYFTEECDRLKSVFSKLKYPKHLVDSTVKTFLISRVIDQSLLQSKSTTENTIRVVIPFKDQVSANIVKTQLKDLSVKLQVNVQPVFTSRKIAHEFPTNEPKPQLIDQQCVVYNFKCDQCDAGYVGYTRGHLFVRVDGHRSKTSSVRKHYDNRHPGRIPDDLHSCFKVLKKCQNKFDCLVNEMLLIKQLRPCLNVKSDSIRAKVYSCNRIFNLFSLDNGAKMSPKRRTFLSLKIIFMMFL